MRGNNAFVTAMVLETNQYIRLLGPDGWLPYPHSEYQIGQIWDIGFKKARTTQDPHNEDVIVLSHSYLRSIDNISAYILQSGVRIWRGSIDHIFDSRLLWAEAGAGYISELQRNVTSPPWLVVATRRSGRRKKVLSSFIRLALRKPSHTQFFFFAESFPADIL